MNEKETKKGFSVKLRILTISIIPAVIMGIAMLVTGIMYMKNGMEEEVLKGLLSSAYSYRDTGIANNNREAGDNAIETDLKNLTGYDFTWFDNDTRKNSSLGASVIGTKAADTVISEVIRGKKQFTSKSTDVAGQKYFVAYVPVTDESGAVTAMAFTGVSRESVQNQIWRSISVMLLIVILLIIITVAVALLVSVKMAKAVKVMENVITNLSNGKFVKADKYIERSDEIGHALRSTNNLIDKLTSVVGNIQKASKSVGSQSKELLNNSNQISGTADSVSQTMVQMATAALEQAENIQVANENTADLSNAISDVSDKSDELAVTAESMNKASLSSAEALRNLSSNMESMAKSIESIIATMNETNNAVQTVRDKADGITAIAAQTNLLALNASIEAARAGEAGRGFAVVAEEIGVLANQSNVTADEIKKEMANLSSKSADAIKETDEISDIGKIVTQVVTETVETINDLIINVESTVNGVSTISEVTERCDSSKSVIIDAMTSLSAISEENAASTEETSASMEELNATVNFLATSANQLNEVAEQLEEEMKFFDI